MEEKKKDSSIFKLILILGKYFIKNNNKLKRKNCSCS